MREVLIVVAIFAGLIIGAFALQSHPSSSLPERRIATPILIKDVGPFETVNGMRAPIYETACVKETMQCRKVWHPALHQKLVTFCQDPQAPGGIIFYQAGNRYCHA